MPLSLNPGQGFNSAVFNCMDRALSSILGRPATDSLYFAIQLELSLVDDGLEKNPLKIIEGLRAILGQAGYSVLEPAMINEVKSHFEISGGRKDLHALVEESKRKYLLES